MSRCLSPAVARLAGTAALAAMMALAAPVAAEEQRTALKICADPNYLPYSDDDETGFENRIAAILGAELGLPVTYTWFPQRMGFIRNTLRAETEDGTSKCDLVMGLPAGYELAVTTRPYYHSTYALVFVKGRGLDDVTSAADLLALPPERRDALRFGLAERNPGTVWMQRHNLLPQLTVAYTSQPGDPSVRPGQFEQEDLLAGNIDATIMWGPIAGYFARNTSDAEIVVIPMPTEPGVRLHFGIAAGVRFGDKAWRDQVQALLDDKREAVNDVLREFGVPLVDENGALL